MTEPVETVDYKALIDEAQQHLEKGAVVKAMQIYYDLHERDPNSIEVLRRLVGINLHMEIHDQAVINLQKLITLEPLKSSHYDQLAEVYGKQRDWEQACETYYGLILRTPKAPEAHFNLAYYLRRAGKFEASIESYQRALKFGIKQPEEVHLNMAVIHADDLRREADAERHLNEALKIKSDYIPALYNLANLHEDRGDKKETIELFEKILAIEPMNARALARLAPLSVARPADDPLVKKLYEVSKSRGFSLSDKVDALYALGKTHNDCGEFDLAFDNYSAANALNAMEFPPYDKAAAESYFQQIIDTVTRDWVAGHAASVDAQPIFICGMFRSGSTLVEQMLAAHPDITAGGERDLLIRELSEPKMQYPQDLAAINSKSLDEIAQKYLAQSRALFPDARHLTDKRPDNFLYVGLLKALFPKAKIIYTMRQPLDNCLSVYFVRLARSMSYAVSLDTIAHFYDQQVRLRDHWRALLGDDLCLVDYDKLINDPKPEIERALNYLGMAWHDDCLAFHELRNTVKTASVWQVREPLYKTSSGRWRHYEKHLAGLIAHYGGGTATASHE